MEPRVCDTVGNVKDDVSAATAVDGRRSRWDAHRATRRDDLIDAAIRAIKRHGAGVGMDQIAADAGTSKPVVYRYFADKTELHRAVTQRVVGTILATLRTVTDRTPPAQALIRGSVAAYLALLEQSPELYRFVVDHPYLEAVDGAEPATYREVIADLLAEQLGRSLRAGGLDPAFAHPWGDAIVGFINSASLWWLDHPGAMTRDQLADYLSALLWGGAAGVQTYAGQPADPTPPPGVFPRLSQED
jgi:AcrR family transcriptional regulator